MIQEAIDEDSNVSEPFISEGTMNDETYFLNVFFWSDMSYVHYTRKVKNELKEQNVDFIEKGNNSTNIPPIGRF